MNIQEKNPILNQGKTINFEYCQFKGLQKVLYTRKLSQKQIESIKNLEKGKQNQISLISDHVKIIPKSSAVQTSTALPILIYLLFTNKNLSIKLNCAQFQKIKTQAKSNISSNTQDLYAELKQSYSDAFFKNKSNEDLLQDVHQKLAEFKREQIRKKLNKNQDSQDFIFKDINIQIYCNNQDEVQQLSYFLQIFWFVFGSIVENCRDIKINVKKIKLMLNLKQDKEQFSSSKVSIERLGFFFWETVFKIKNITSIKIKLPQIQHFLNPINVLKQTYVQQKKSLQMIGKSPFEITQQKIQYYQTKKYFQLKNTFALQIQVIMLKTDFKQLNAGVFVTLLEVVPNLIGLTLKTQNLFDQHNRRQVLLKESYKIFKALSQLNLFIENLTFWGCKLQYDIQSQQKTTQNHQTFLNEKDDSDGDKNLFWMQKMQQNCPYLSGVMISFMQYNKTEQRHFSENERRAYLRKIEKTREIMNLFYKRGMNNQTYFNTIKIMQSKGFDYETILGVLDKLSPFSPF